MKLNGHLFENSPDCKGVSFTIPGVIHDIASIEITGRYPESGWAVNHEANETVYVARGIGELALRSGEVTPLAQGDVVAVPPETPFGVAT